MKLKHLIFSVAAMMVNVEMCFHLMVNMLLQDIMFDPSGHLGDQDEILVTIHI